MGALAPMAASLRHRGPDGEGVWSDPEAGIGLAHCRLAVVDLSPNGAQPMLSASGHHVICFNGEIYNHKSLRLQIEACQEVAWRGTSDTEVLLEAIDLWGVEEALDRSNGMFALAVWDRARRVLTLARDRMGEKPLYVGRVGGNIVFASELKALCCAPGWKGLLDAAALAELMRFGYIRAPLSIYEQIYKLPAGNLVRFSADEALASLRLEDFVARLHPYWSLERAVDAALDAPFKGGIEDALECLQPLLIDSVKQRMEADVPVGALLSGGVDSSLVVALMQECSTKPVRTFTVGFSDKAYDESARARRVAEYLETEHTELTVSPDEALALIPRLPVIYDEPFADPSQIPTALICALTRQSVTVALSGDGGDELFMGYRRYADAHNAWKVFGCLPGWARASAAHGLQSVGRLVGGLTGFRLARYGRRVRARDFDQCYANFASLSLVQTTRNLWPLRHPGGASLPDWLSESGQRMRFMDQLAYLPDDILTKTDRASMASALELRVPLLDHRIVEFAWSLPSSMLAGGGVGKRLLRQALYRKIPRVLVDRPKQGFDVPIDDWLRGPLRVWAQELLYARELRSLDLFDFAVVDRLWSEQIQGTARNAYALWPILMFASWNLLSH
ncbi:asparagine synthase (glutamine-hydrolyzing) [Niveibacterium terrae]|uniref:asparagine synthase (glutamine-hydrolyzing) n=1 Tax=Niveibacterium terrae TaxID=3373598 RepID=UPI003A91D42B